MITYDSKISIKMISYRYSMSYHCPIFISYHIWFGSHKISPGYQQFPMISIAFAEYVKNMCIKKEHIHTIGGLLFPWSIYSDSYLHELSKIWGTKDSGKTVSSMATGTTPRRSGRSRFASFAERVTRLLRYFTQQQYWHIGIKWLLT